MPLENTECQGACTFAQVHSVAIENTHSFNVGFTLKESVSNTTNLEGRDRQGPSPGDLKGAFNAGATWSYSRTETTGTITTRDKPDYAKDHCGYWTFVPYYVT